MHNILPISTLENRSPIFKVENGCIVSKYGDVTACFRVQMPELFTLTSDNYTALHAAWCKAIKVLPDYSVLHKQDWFVKECYTPQYKEDLPSFLGKSFERHFSGREFLNHSCYLYLSKSSPENMRKNTLLTTLSRGQLVPKEMLNGDTIAQFLDAVKQFAGIMTDSTFVKLTRLAEDDIIGTKNSAGILDKYFSLSTSETRMLSDIQLNPESMVIGSNSLCLYALSDTEDLPLKVSTDRRFEGLSTDKSECRLSFAAPLGLLLPCNHIYNQYIFVGNSAENLRKLETTAKRMRSFAKFSRQNEVNSENINAYLTMAAELELKSVKAHFNVFAWSSDRNEMDRVKNDVGSRFTDMNCTARHNAADAPTLFWAGIPGNAADFPCEDAWHTFVPPAVCFFTQETNYKNSLSPFGIKLTDRFNGSPVHIDISDEPRHMGIISNRNKFILGGSGSGKSFFTNHLVRQYNE